MNTGTINAGGRFFLIGFLVLSVSGLNTLAQEVPPRTFAGQTLEVSEELLDAGLVYHLQPGVDTQLAITSTMPLQRLVVTANRGVGYIVTPFDLQEGSAPLLAAALRMPVVALTSGLTQIDPQLAGPQLLNAREYPEIAVLLKRLNHFQASKFGPSEMTYDLELTAAVTVLGKSHDLEVQGQMSFFPSSLITMTRNVGDLAAFRTSFKLKASDLGVTIPGRFAQLLSDELDVDVFLMFNTVSPDRSGDPRDDPGIYSKQLHFSTLLEDLEQVDEAYRYARELSQEIQDNPKELSRLARLMFSTARADSRDLRFAGRLVARAIEASTQPDPEILANLARIESAMGRFSEAVQWQQKAVESAPEGRLKRALERELEAYKQKAAAAGGG